MKKTVSRILALLLAIVLTCGLLPVGAFAAGTPMKIVVESVNAQPGGEVKVAVKVEDNPGIASMKLNIAFDSVLTLTAVEYNQATWAGMFQAPQNYKNPVTLNWFDGTKNFTGADAVFATLTFRVADDAEENTTADITVSYDPDDIYNIAEKNVDCTVVDGAVTVCSLIHGDINGDRLRNNKDVTRLFQYLANWDVQVIEKALDTNNDKSVNNKDLTRLFQFLANWDVELWCDGNLLVTEAACQHKLEKVAYKAPACEAAGNIEYYHCALCNKNFNNASAGKELTDVTLAATGHDVVIDPAVAPTYSASGLTEGSHCHNCGKVFKEQEVIPPITGMAITYNVVGVDSYLAQQTIENPNPTQYIPNETPIVLKNLAAPAGYEFLGWYDAPQSVGGKRMTEIPKGSTGDITLYAYWKEIQYDVTYKLYQTPLGQIKEEKYLTYTVSKGLKDLPNPEINNYIFLGWYANDGKEVTEISAGTTGDITLNAYWTSKRNLAKAVRKLEDPIIIEDSSKGVIYFTYELGTIENVPLSDALWTIQSVSGLTQQKSETYTTSISNEQASEIAKTISNATVDSATWTLSKNWNDVTEVSEEWAEENGMTQEEANTKVKTESGTISITDSNGGCNTTTKTDGTTTLNYNSQNYTHGNGAEINAKVHGNYTTEVGGDWGLANASAKVEVGLEVGGGYEQHQDTNEHTGTDTTTVDTTVATGTTSWNSAKTKTETQEASESSTVSKALSTIISNTKGYGKSYAEGGSNSEARDFSTTQSESTNASSTITYFNSETKTTTTTYSTDGKSEGYYRMVVAGTVHVFGVVGYDVGTKSYFTYTFNVLDDKTKEFLDYSADGSFDDYENSVLPFEIPYFVYEYVTSKTAHTEGLSVVTNSSNRTAYVDGFDNSTETDVIIPSYVSSGKTAYKVTGISADAFAGKPVESIILSEYIKEIPAGAFKNCTSLTQVAGKFTEIGDDAFSGCTKLENFTVSTLTTQIGKSAFKNVPSIKINVLNENAALAKAKTMLGANSEESKQISTAKEITKEVVDAVVSSGAKNILLNTSKTLKDIIFTINVPNISSFELVGGSDRTYKDLRVKSDAASTILTEVKIRESSRIPLDISSKDLTLEVVDVETGGYTLLLSNASPRITLRRDNTLTSTSGKAIVCKTPELISQKVDMASGVLYVNGNVYVNGTDEQINQLKNFNKLVKNGQIIAISNDDYAKYIKGSYTVTFDANGGEVSTKNMTAYFGAALGKLPVPTRTGFDFAGWYTKDGVAATENTPLDTSGDITLYARWNAMAYTVSWNTGTGYTIKVTRTESPYANAATGELANGAKIYYGDKLSITYTATTGYTIDSKGVTSVTVDKNVTASDIFASATVNAYKQTWTAGTGYTVVVERTASPLAGKLLRELNSEDKVYHGDVLKVTYTANTGYSITNSGKTSITVTGDLTASDIYATASLNSYTYKIVCKSSNDTALGTFTATYKYGTTNTITPPAISGYTTPAAQIVKWDSTGEKTITFVYTPIPTATSQFITSGTWWNAGGSTGITYSVNAEYRNRTANSVQVRVVWTQSIKSAAFGYNQYFYCSLWHNGINQGNTGNVKIASTSTWPYYSANGPWHTNSVTASSGWVTVPLNTTNETIVGILCDWWTESSSQKGSWGKDVLKIPAY